MCLWSPMESRLRFSETFIRVIIVLLYFLFIKVTMELKTWLTVVRVLNCLCSLMLVGFQIWFIVDLVEQHRTIYGFMLRIWAPIFIMYFIPNQE